MRKKKWFSIAGAILGILIRGNYFLYCQQTTENKGFFYSSLHYTTQGMKYWYQKENGGFESITGIPYEKLSCKNCHTANCDPCHSMEKEGKLFYSTKQAEKQELCLICHSRQKVMLYKIDQPRNELDLHFAKGMECLDCHTAREVHGDGIAYQSMLEPEAMDTKCENCHKEIPSTLSHKVHQDRLDCSACHTRRVITCYNCHFEAQVKEEKKISIPITDWVFLINRQGKVTSANFQSLVYKGKTFVVFAPFFSHSVMKEGRKCDECHGTEIVKQMGENKLKLTWFESGEVKSVKGVIPIVEDKLEFLFLDYKDGQWIPMAKAPNPMVQFTTYGQPITQEQLRSMLKSK